MNIDRCYCFQVRFARLKAIVEKTGADTIAALQEEVQFGQQCQLCHPYVRRMLETGTTVFHETLPQEDSAA